MSHKADEMTVPWWVLDYAHTTAIRSKLASTFAPNTANRMLAALRGVLKAAFKLGLMTSDHMTRACSVGAVRGTRVAKGRALSQGELRALFEHCDPSTPGGARNAALLGIMYGGGLRRSEIVGLDRADYDKATGKLVVKGKGNKERVAWATNGSRDALDAWLAVRGDEAGPLFLPVTKGGKLEHRRMSDQAVAESQVDQGRVAIGGQGFRSKCRERDVRILRASLTELSTTFVIGLGAPFSIGVKEVGMVHGGLLVRNSQVGFTRLVASTSFGWSARTA